MTNEKLVREYLLENMDQLQQIVSELNGWNGCLESLEAMSNDEEFFEIYFEGKPMDAVRAAQYGDYNYTDEYVRFNGYGNLESFNDWQYEKELKDSIDEIIDNLIEYQSHLYLSDELEELLNPDITTCDYCGEEMNEEDYHEQSGACKNCKEDEESEEL
jgi:hypothetical protein